MKVEITPATTLRFFKKNWFTLSIFLLGLLFFLKRDLSFHLNVATPKDSIQKKSGPVEKITDSAPAFSGNLSNDRLELPFIGGRKNTVNPLQELAAIDEKTRIAFLERFAKVAKAEQKKYGVPASIILAVSMYQSYSGKRDLSLDAHNFFGLPCGGSWDGECVNFQGQSYRRYETAWSSFRDFSLFSIENFRSIQGKSYKDWAMGMQKSGFGESDNFGKNIVQIIEAYGLQKLDI